MKSKACKYILLFVWLSSVVAFAAPPIDNVLTHGIVGDAIYPWERSGFLIGGRPITLSNQERLAENPQLADLDGDESLYLLVHTIDLANQHRIYKAYFLAEEKAISLGLVYGPGGNKTLQDQLGSTDIKAAELSYSSVLGRMPVFQINENIIKKYGDLYHFGEDYESPSLSLESLVPIFSPNGDGFNDDYHLVYSFEDNRSVWVIDAFFEVIARTTGAVIVSTINSYTMMNVSWNYYWNGKDILGNIQPDGWYYIRISGTDEAGNPVQNKTEDFYLKTTLPAVENFTYTILNTEHTDIVMKQSPKMMFTIATQEQITTVNGMSYQIWLTKQEDPYYRQSLYGVVSESIILREWFILDDYERPLEDGFYTAEVELIDAVGLISQRVSVGFEINRDPIIAVIEKNNNIFTPHTPDDNYPDAAEFTITLQDRGITVNVPYAFQIFSPQNELIIQRENYSDSKIIWDGKNTEGEFLEDGQYILKVQTIDNVGNTFEAVERIIKTKIPISISSPKAELTGHNMVPIIGTINDPGGTTFMDFERFDIFVRSGEHSDFSLSENDKTDLDLTKWQAIIPLPYYMSPEDSDFPYSNYGVRTGYGAKLAFWQPTENGIYTLLLRTKDAEGYTAIATQIVNVNLRNELLNVFRLLPTGDNITFNIQGDSFTLVTQWDTGSFQNLFSYEINIYTVSGDKKEKIIRNYSKTGNVPNNQTTVLWDGKDQWRKYVDSGSYIMEIFFYDLIDNALSRQELSFSLNNYYDEPLVIERYEIVNDSVLFVKINKPANCEIAIYNGLEKIYEQTLVYDASEQELILPKLPAGFYRVNINAASLGDQEDAKDASVTLMLDQELSKDGAELFLPTGNIEPQHYFAFEAERTGTFYPEITGSITLKINGLREKYPYDPYTLAVTYKASEGFWTYPLEKAANGFDIESGSGEESVRFFLEMIQDIYVHTYSDSDGDVSRWWKPSGGIYESVAQGAYNYSFGGSVSGVFGKKNYLSMNMDVYYKSRQTNYDQKNLYWNNTDFAKNYAIEPSWETLNNDLPSMLDKFYLQRGTRKNVILDFKSARPEYEKNIEKTYLHLWCSKVLKHYGDTTFHHEFNIMQQIEYTEEEFIKTTVLDTQRYSDEGNSPSDTFHGTNYTTVNMLIDSFAEPQKEPFEFEITIPLRSLYKGHDFYSGNLADFVGEVLGEGSQIIQIPYKVSGNIKYFYLEMPISVNTVVYSAQIISINVAHQDKIEPQITHIAGYPQLLVKADYELPWNTALDANLRSGKIKGIVVYDPLNAGQINLADYYPSEAVNRGASMFHVKNGIVTLNPQVNLNDNWDINIKDLRNITAIHPAIAVDNIYYLNDNPLGDYFTVKLDHTTYIDAYLPVFGWIADGYKENGYSLFIRESSDSNWREDSYYTDYFSSEYKLPGNNFGYLLGFVNISNYNSDNVLRLVSNGTKGISETLSNIVLGKKVTQGQQARVYAYDFRVWLDIYPQSIVTPDIYYITITPQKYDKAKMNLPENLADPFGPIYSMKPHGLDFNPEQKPILTSVLYNPDDEDIDLSRLVVYHLDKNELKTAQTYAIADANNDGWLQKNEQGSLSSFVEGFSQQFYVPALNKLTFDSYTVYSGSENVILTAHGNPDSSIEGFLYGDYSTTVIDQSPDNPSGDYTIYLPPLTEGAHKFEARKYQVVNSYKSVGPLSDVVNIVVNLSDPVLTISQTGNTLNTLYIEFNSNEKTTLNIQVSDNIWSYLAVKGLNQQKVEFVDMADGIYTATVYLTDLSGRMSNKVGIEIMSDHTVPTGGVITAPTSGQNLPSLIALAYTIPQDDLSGIARFVLEYEVSENIWEQLTTLNPAETTREIYVPDNVPATFSMRTKIIDKAGNINYSPSVNIRIDNNYIYRLNEQNLIPVIADHRVTGFILDNNFSESGTELFILTDPTNRSDLSHTVNNSIGVTIDITNTEPVVYLIGRKYGLWTNVIPLPLQLPHFTEDLYSEDPLHIEWPHAGVISYVIDGDIVQVYYQPLGSSLVYLSDTAMIKSDLTLTLESVDSTEVLLYAISTANYLYRPISGKSISLNYAISASVTRSLVIQDRATKTIQVQSSYAHAVELEDLITVSARLENANSIETAFTLDTVCYPPEELLSSQNIVHWIDSQTDIAKYKTRLYLEDSLVSAMDIAQKQITLTDLQASKFYRLELNAVDQLGNISATKSVAVYNGQGKLFNVKPLNFTQFVEKAVRIDFVINTYAQDVLYAYQEYAPQVITGNVYLYQAFNLQMDKVLIPAQSIKYYFDVKKLDRNIGGDISTVALYYFKDNVWQKVPESEYVYTADQIYEYTGAQFYPLAIGYSRFERWVIDGVSPNYSDGARDIDLLVYAVNTENKIVSQNSRVKILTANAEILLDPVHTKSDGYGVLPIRLGLGREVTYSIQISDDTGVTGSISFYADRLPITFNALMIDGWQRVTDSVALKEGTQYFMQIDVDAYPEAQVTYELTNYIKMNLGSKNQFLWRPGYKDAGTKNLEIKIKDGQYSVRTQVITFNIENTNRKSFIVSNNPVYVAEGQTPPLIGAFAIMDYDEDDEIKEIRILNLPLNFNIQRVSGKPIISYELQPDYGQNGTYNITVLIYDGHEWATENIMIYVQRVNRPAVVFNPQRIKVLENQLVTCSIDIYDADGDPVSLDFSKFPFPVEVISTENRGGNVTRFYIWIRPGFVETNYQSYILGIYDTWDLNMADQQFDIGKDTIPPNAAYARPPDSSTYAQNYRYYFTVNDNVWTTINVQVYRGTDLILDETHITNNISVSPPLLPGLNNLRFVFTDGVGNSSELLNTIKLENISRYDTSLGIYVEIPIGAYAVDAPVFMAKQNPADLINMEWQASHMPYSIAQFSTPSFLATFDGTKLSTPLNDWTTLNVPAKFVVKVQKLSDNNQKLNPVVWDNVNKKWLAHTAKRLTPEQFGELKVPLSVFNVSATEELLYFESPVLGLFSIMLFETTERPQIRLVHTEDYYDIGVNKINFTIKGNYLRLENTKLWLNGTTLNYEFKADKYMDNIVVLSTTTSNTVLEYDPRYNLYAIAVSNFQEGINTLRVQAENLVHVADADMSLEVNTRKLNVREIYAYPNPARKSGEEMIRFSCILSKPADINIRIYTNQGRLVKELKQNGKVGFNAVPWDGKDGFNNQTANGMYLYVITIEDGDNKIMQRKKVGILL